MKSRTVIERVRQAARQRVLFLPHAVRQMARPGRMIEPREVHLVVERGDLIEDYPEDARGHSCLLCGEGNGGRLIHVVCSPKDDFLAVITAYLPSATQWAADGRTRRFR